MQALTLTWRLMPERPIYPGTNYGGLIVIIEDPETKEQWISTLCRYEPLWDTFVHMHEGRIPGVIAWCYVPRLHEV